CPARQPPGRCRPGTRGSGRRAANGFSRQVLHRSARASPRRRPKRPKGTQRPQRFPWGGRPARVVAVEAAIQLRGVTKRFATPNGGVYTALRDLTMEVAPGEFCAVVGPTGSEDRYPHQLSGGMRKRVGLAQSLINGPRILLMDEPFSALDVQTRTLMENELLALWASTSASVVFVTHDLEEAIALADRVVVLTAGPGTVKGTYAVDLPRPRNVAEVRFQPRFAQI